MEISSNNPQSAIQTEVIKKTLQTEQDAVTRIIEGAQETQSKQQEIESAKKTGMGTTLDIQG
ncbi:MAG: hypothetical protein RBR59_02985 [Sulfurimonadaceae bacterium]|jgi:hypothetical protein|nr:hypothetical protein [Sulfurimonadaceae bacterium]